jgi:uncharacterized protein YraI
MRGADKAGRTIKGIAKAGPLQRATVALLIASLLAACSDSGTATDETKLHQTPTNASKVLATIPQGAAIKIGDCSNGWCRVRWSGREGYALAKSVHISEHAFRSTSQSDQAPDENDAEEENVAPSDEGAPPSTSN